jgi:hypothetical protein
MSKFKTLSSEEMYSIKGGTVTIIEQGTDAGGNYVIYDNGTQCVKVYPSSGGGNPEFPHVH